jgi:ABC-type multidrug transport system fused ATPase/permease subunit
MAGCGHRRRYKAGYWPRSCCTWAGSSTCWDLSQFYNSFQSAAASLEKISGVLTGLGGAEPATRRHCRPPQPVTAARRPGPEPPRGIPDARAGAEVGSGGAVGYRATPVLPGLDLTIPAGQTLALVGATGAGKTTVARLLARFYDPGQGSVRLDGVDLRDLPDRVLRREIVLVTQENFVFSGSVADNIRLGRPDATQAEVEAAARAIGADAFISALPGGYQADVGKRGGRLSAGRRQLVAPPARSSRA